MLNLREAESGTLATYPLFKVNQAPRDQNHLMPVLPISSSTRKELSQNSYFCATNGVYCGLV
jgi:hypothetical protein